MQIFMPYSDLNKSAAALDDTRLNKQIIECAQIASTGFWINNCSLGETLTAEGLAYLPSHEHHPLCKWASKCQGNMYLVLGFGITCCNERELRGFVKHKTKENLFALIDHAHKMCKLGKATAYPNFTTNHKHIINTSEAYKAELALKWYTDKRKPVWTNRVEPDFK